MPHPITIISKFISSRSSSAVLADRILINVPDVVSFGYLLRMYLLDRIIRTLSTERAYFFLHVSESRLRTTMIG